MGLGSLGLICSRATISTAGSPQIHRPEMLDLKGKNALITGGSAGLGAATVRQLAAEGVNVVINYSNLAERAEKLAEEVRVQHHVQAHVIQADVFGGAQALEQLVSQAVGLLGLLDIVVSNAGWTKIVPYDDLDALDEELWDGVFGANIKSHFFLYRAAKKHLEKNDAGGVFLVSASVAGRMVYGSSIPYAVLKAGLIHLVKMLAKSQGNKVRVHAVCPGLLLTEWGKRFSDEKVAASKKASPIGQLPDVDETAAHFVFLSKLETSTGTVVGHDGGISIDAY